jgi:hypothetical protein
MVTINFNYSGAINEIEINGNGVLNISPETGSLMATLGFSSFPASFSPLLGIYSFVSKSCINGAKEEGDAKNIIHVANNHYTSIREIEYFNENNGDFLGNIIMHGVFTKVSENLFIADSVLLGTYSGPVNVVKPDGYILPLSKNGEYMLEGSFMKILESDEGLVRTIHQHRYYFNDGVQLPLEDIKGVLTFDTNETHWYPEEKILQVKGTSIVQPL